MKARNDEPLIDRILRRIKKLPDGCWEWTGSLSYGYGILTYKRKRMRVHICTFNHFVGPVPVRSELDHLCKNKRCCNPDHLEPVSHRVNILRSDHPNVVLMHRGVCKRGHAIAGDNALPTSDGRIRCKKCRQRIERESILRRKSQIQYL